MNFEGNIYIATILLERNRHQEPKVPTYRVSEWMGRFARDGFDGIELWENHAALADEAERAAIRDADPPVAVFNTYAPFGADGADQRDAAAEMTAYFRAAGAKYNLGPDPDLWDTYVASVREWAGRLPPDCRVLCECHPGTVVEAPDAAERLLDALGAPRFQAMIHPFSRGLDVLEAWLDRLGGRITHAHVQYRPEGKEAQRLSAAPKRNAEVCQMLRERGWAGSLSLEFTEGMNRPDESIEDSYRAALDDRDFLREHL